MSAALASPMRVFLVDDDVDTTESMRLLLQLWGHDVHVANGGMRAIERAPVIKPDLMLVDLGMPLVDGLQVARSVRKHAELAPMALVAVSGYADAPHRSQALDAGFDEYLVKPLHVGEITALLNRVRDRIAAAQARTAQSAKAVAVSQAMKAKAMAWLDGQGPARPDGVPVRVEKSGISDLVSFAGPRHGGTLANLALATRLSRGARLSAAA